jgi:hypothetical protein
MLLYFPESKGQIDSNGYNNAIRLFRKALSEFVTDHLQGASFRVYCNLPWHNNPRELIKASGLPLLVYTMYESTRLPSGWVRWLNKHADVIAVPTQWCKDVFIASGVEKPIAILSLGIDPEEMPYAVKDSREDSEYVFLWQGVAYDPKGRKGVDVVVDAFKQLVADGLIPNARLVLKYRPNEGIRFDGVDLPCRITHLQKVFTREEMLNLYKNVDCCINPTRGEGFGFIPLEQMAMGKPVMVTDWSVPYSQSGVCIPLLYRLAKSYVAWNHKSISLGKNGILWNAGGLMRGFAWLPKLISKRPDGDKVKSCPPYPVSKKDAFVAKIVNFLSDIQRITGFYHNPKSKFYTLYQEHPGYDAVVNIDELKQDMLWCYNNRAQAKNMGKLAREYVFLNWSLDKMKSDFKNNLLPLLEGYKNVRNS